MQVVISTAILLIATIIAASVFTAAAISELYTFQNTFKEVGSKNQALYESSITIEGEAQASSPLRIVIWVKNIGTTSFQMSGSDSDPQYWDVFITFPSGNVTKFPYTAGGCESPNECFDTVLLNGQAGSTMWETGETVQITICGLTSIPSGSYQVSLSLSNGATAQDNFSF